MKCRWLFYIKLYVLFLFRWLEKKSLYIPFLTGGVICSVGTWHFLIMSRLHYCASAQALIWTHWVSCLPSLAWVLKSNCTSSENSSTSVFSTLGWFSLDLVHLSLFTLYWYSCLMCFLYYLFFSLGNPCFCIFSSFYNFFSLRTLTIFLCLYCCYWQHFSMAFGKVKYRRGYWDYFYIKVCILWDTLLLYHIWVEF